MSVYSSFASGYDHFLNFSICYLNRMNSISEEGIFRWGIQDKLLSNLLRQLPNTLGCLGKSSAKKLKRTFSKIEGYSVFGLDIKNVTRVAITSLVFAYLHYLADLSEFHSNIYLVYLAPFNPDAKTQMLDHAYTSFFINLWSSICYGIVYEKWGLAGSTGARILENILRPITTGKSIRY